MNDEEPTVHSSSFISSHRFLVLVIAAIIISLLLVAVSLELYNISGAAQLDLSRPGYRSISKDIISDDNSFVVFPSSGAVTGSTIDDFEKLFNNKAKDVNTIDAYGGDPLSSDALQISAPIEN